MFYEPRSNYKFRKVLERARAKRIGTGIIQTTNSRKTPYTSEYDLRKNIKEKQVIDEINRQNLYSDYGV